MVKKTFIDSTGNYKITRLSRWIKIRTAYNINSRNRLYAYYYKDDNGFTPGEPGFNKSIAWVDYFKYNGVNYALSEFINLHSVWMGCTPYMFTDTDGKTTIISGVQCDEYFHPLYIEVSDDGEYVRVYTVELINEERYHL